MPVVLVEDERTSQWLLEDELARKWKAAYV